VTFADTGDAAFLLCGAKAVLTSKKDSVCKAFPAFDAPGEGGGTHPDCPQRFFAPLRGNKCRFFRSAAARHGGGVIEVYINLKNAVFMSAKSEFYKQKVQIISK